MNLLIEYAFNFRCDDCRIRAVVSSAVIRVKQIDALILMLFSVYHTTKHFVRIFVSANQVSFAVIKLIFVYFNQKYRTFIICVNIFIANGLYRGLAA